MNLNLAFIMIHMVHGGAALCGATIAAGAIRGAVRHTLQLRMRSCAMQPGGRSWAGEDHVGKAISIDHRSLKSTSDSKRPAVLLVRLTGDGTLPSST